MRWAQRFIVWLLLILCVVLDSFPVLRREYLGNGESRWYWSGAQWGCYPFRLAAKSDELDQRWKTGVWMDGPRGEGP